MSEFSFQFIVFSYPFFFWSGFFLFLFLTLPFNALMEAGSEVPYSFPSPLKILHSFFRLAFFFLLWCFCFEVFFLKSPDEQELDAIDRQWLQILEEKRQSNFIDAIWGDEAEELPACPAVIWAYHGKPTELSFWDYRKCVKAEFVTMRTGRPPREESLGRLFKEVVQYNTSYFAWNGYVEKLNSFMEQNDFLKNISNLTFIQKIKDDMDVDTAYIVEEAKMQKEKQLRQLKYSVSDLQNDPEIFFKKRPPLPESTFSPETTIVIPEDSFSVQPLFPVVPITPAESTTPHKENLSTNDYIVQPVAKP